MINLILCKSLNKLLKKSGVLWLVLFSFATPVASSGQQVNPYYKIGTITNNYFFKNNIVPDQIAAINPAELPSESGCTYQWEGSLSPVFNSLITLPGSSTGATYTFTAPLSQTTYFRRKTTNTTIGLNVTSNIIKLTVVSPNWEDISFIREHDVITTGVSANYDVIDQLTVGQKLQTTTYIDGLGRPVEKVSRETATPTSGNLWGDAVQFFQYDVKGRQPKQYLPYTIQYTTSSGTESGRYKTAPVADQASYYNASYSETLPYSNITFYNDPFNRAFKINTPGSSWQNNPNQTDYDLNGANEHVKIWDVDYISGDAPINTGEYSANSLSKTIRTDESGNQVIEYANNSGQIVLTKMQIADAPSVSYSGWLCTYNVYDDFGLLRFVLQPKAVSYLNSNGWTFAGTSGQQVLDELCFRYDYDDKGRCVSKKAPGAAPLKMIYDSRDRVVFMQDGNQANKYSGSGYSEWTVNIYDDLDRVTITALYKTNKNGSQLQQDVDNATVSSSVTLTTPGDAINDLVVDTRDGSITNYKARNSISFVSDDGGSFATTAGDSFTAEIDQNASQPQTTITVTTFKNPIPASSLNNAGITTILQYQFYDNYSFTGAANFDNTSTNTAAYSTSDANVFSIAVSKRALSLSTGSMLRVLGTNTFLSKTNFYDEKGRLIQTNAANIKDGQDVTTFQYHFDGRLLSVDEKHSTAHSGYTNFRILTKNVFDKLGRITSIQKKYSSNAFKTIASYDYDDMGRLAVKHLDPGYTGSGKSELESLTYTYNIHNQITGINQDYARKRNGYNKWNNFFGLYLGYEDKENTFGNPLLDGHVSGALWNTQGDDAQRKYIFTYDHAGRLSNANYTERQKTSDSWDNSKMDFSVTGTNGNIAYDGNGNISNMLQRGVMPGISSPVDIDKLSYTYNNSRYAYTNKLFKVKDNTTQTSTNGTSGDFKDGTNGTNDDYAYDDNGNLILDNNKNVSSIAYNFLDKPETITIAGKGILRIVYDAAGNKLQKVFTPQNGGQSTTTTYINSFVYKEDAVQYINFEEGRLRVISPVSQSNGYDGLTIDGNNDLPNGKKGVYDYFIRDYQENVRMILTEENTLG